MRPVDGSTSSRAPAGAAVDGVGEGRIAAANRLGGTDGTKLVLVSVAAVAVASKPGEPEGGETAAAPDGPTGP
jgi:hypothetical protein